MCGNSSLGSCSLLAGVGDWGGKCILHVWVLSFLHSTKVGLAGCPFPWSARICLLPVALPVRPRYFCCSSLFEKKTMIHDHATMMAVVHGYMLLL